MGSIDSSIGEAVCQTVLSPVDMAVRLRTMDFR